MDSISLLDILNNACKNKKLLAKLLAFNFVVRLERKVSIYKDDCCSYPFSEFVDSVVSKSVIACDPVASLQALKGDQTTASKIYR